MITFKNSNSIKIKVYDEQKKFLSSEERMNEAFKDKKVISFDIFDDDKIIGFAMLKEFKKNCYFLWNYAIDYKYQNQNYGYKLLKKLIEFMKEKYKMKVITTTYKYGNDHIKHIYEKIGFIETDRVEEASKINMIYNINNSL